MGAATGNGDYGYIAGGMPSPYKSSIDRIDYSNDTATAASGKGPLSVARTSFGDAATGTDDYGYLVVVIKLMLGYQQLIDLIIVAIQQQHQ